MESRTSGYTGLQIALHWIIAALVVFQLFFGEYMTDFVDAEAECNPLAGFDRFMGSTHYWVGLSLLFLVFIRLAVRMIVGAPRQESSTPQWMVFAGWVTHVLFYCLLLAIPISGLLAYYVWDWMADIHALAKPVLIVLICIHAGAALFHHFVMKDRVLFRMLAPNVASSE